MIYNLAPSYTALLLIVILGIIYNQKKRERSFKILRTKLFNMFVNLSILYCIVDIISFMLNKYLNIFIVNKITFVINWSIFVVILYIMTLYSIIVSKKLRYDSIKDVIKNELLSKIITIISFLMIIILIIIPHENIIQDTQIFFLPESYYYYIIVYILFNIILCLYLFFKNKYKMTLPEKLVVLYPILEFAIMDIFQSTANAYSFMPTAIVIISYYYYYNTENPDLVILEEVKEQSIVEEEKEKTESYFLDNIVEKMTKSIEEMNKSSKKYISANFDKSSATNYLNEMSSLANVLLGEMDNKLDLSNVITNTQTNIINYSFKSFIDTIISKTNKDLKNKNVRLILEIDEKIPRILQGNAPKLNIVLSNIINNAIKFTKVGRIIISVNCINSGSNCELTFKITDTGSGIEEKDKKTLLNNKNMNGIYLSKKMLEEMGGKLWFDSEYEVGSNFYVRLNQQIVDSTSIGKYVDTTEEKDITFVDYSSKKILIVDDDNISIKLLKMHLANYNIQAEVVMSSRECVNNIKRGKKYDLIFMDDMLPKTSGVKTLEILKKLDNLKLFEKPNVVVYTVNVLVGVKEKYLENGFNDYLAKPINPYELDRILKEILNK